MSDRKTAERLLKQHIMPKVELSWGRGFDGLGPTLQQAVVLAQAVHVCRIQDDSIDPSTVVALLDSLHDVITDQYPGV